MNRPAMYTFVGAYPRTDRGSLYASTALTSKEHSMRGEDWYTEHRLRFLEETAQRRKRYAERGEETLARTLRSNGVSAVLQHDEEGALPNAYEGKCRGVRQFGRNRNSTYVEPKDRPELEASNRLVATATALATASVARDIASRESNVTGKVGDTTVSPYQDQRFADRAKLAADAGIPATLPPPQHWQTLHDLTAYRTRGVPGNAQTGFARERRSLRSEADRALEKQLEAAAKAERTKAAAAEAAAAAAEAEAAMAKEQEAPQEAAVPPALSPVPTPELASTVSTKAWNTKGTARRLTTRVQPPEDFPNKPPVSTRMSHPFQGAHFGHYDIGIFDPLTAMPNADLKNLGLPASARRNEALREVDEWYNARIAAAIEGVHEQFRTRQPAQPEKTTTGKDRTFRGMIQEEHLRLSKEGRFFEPTFRVRPAAKGRKGASEWR